MSVKWQTTQSRRKKKKKKEFTYLPTHTQHLWVGFGQTEILLMVALCIEKHEKIILIFNIFHIKGNFNIDKKLIIINKEVNSPAENLLSEFIEHF